MMPKISNPNSTRSARPAPSSLSKTGRHGKRETNNRKNDGSNKSYVRPISRNNVASSFRSRSSTVSSKASKRYEHVDDVFNDDNEEEGEDQLILKNSDMHQMTTAA